MQEWWNNFVDAFVLNFIKDDRWKFLTDGLMVTLEVTVFACLLGVVLGFLVSIIRSTHDNTGKLKIPNFLCKVYLTVWIITVLQPN